MTRWVDNKPVHMLSSFAAREPVDVVKRYDRKEKKIVEIQRPFSIQIYNKFMGGIDMADRMVAHYPHALKNKKFYLRIFFHLLNVSIVNAWIVHNTTINKRLSLVDFKISIISTVFDLSKTNRIRGRPSVTPPPVVIKKRARSGCSAEVRLDGAGHYPDKRNFSSALRCRYKHCSARTRYFCVKCDVPVCPECMKGFHDP